MDVAVEGPPADRSEQEPLDDLAARPGRGRSRSAATVVRSSTGTPSKNSMVRTRGPDSSSMTSGTVTRRQVDLAQQPPVVRHGAGLVAKVELLADLHPETLEQCEQLPGGVLAGLLGDDLEHRLEQVEVARHAVLDAGSQHLDRDPATVTGGRLVDHRDRGRCRSASPRSSRTPPPATCRDRTRPLGGLLEGHGRSGVEAGAELRRHVVAEHARRRRRPAGRTS